MDIYINEKPGITFVQVKGGLSANALANAITKTHAQNQVGLSSRYVQCSTKLECQLAHCTEVGHGLCVEWSERS